VFNMEGGFCATQAMCTHRQGPLSEGSFDNTTVTCPLHARPNQRVDGRGVAWPGEGSASRPYRVTVDG